MLEPGLQHASAALDRAEEEDEFLEALALKAWLEIDLGKPRRRAGPWRSCHLCKPGRPWQPTWR